VKCVIVIVVVKTYCLTTLEVVRCASAFPVVRFNNITIRNYDEKKYCILCDNEWAL
jgi:hypothetical protein